tara:strand:+ start:3469 stop:4071 length:603 start_codon:yes stop_codon:yes gene_type:complete
MIDINDTEEKILKLIFLDFKTDYNSNNLSKKLKKSPQYTNRIIKDLANKKLVIGKQMGKAVFYKLNFDKEYTIKLLELIFTPNKAPSNYIGGWISQLIKLKGHTKSIILFGSIFKKESTAGDVDVCFVLKSYDALNKINKEIENINKLNKLKIHSLHIIEKDFIDKLKKGDKPLYSVINDGLVINGQETFVRIVKNAQRN